MTTTHTKQFAWGDLTIQADFAQASSSIRYQIDGEPFRSTPLQVADAKHDEAIALQMVNEWLEAQS